MAFTDDELTHFKNFIRKSVIRHELDRSGNETILFKYKMESLINRLEALDSAVKVAREIQRGAISWDHFDAVYKACQEAAGK